MSAPAAIFDRGVCGDVTKFCGHGMHERCAEAGSAIVMVVFWAHCLCPCHRGEPVLEAAVPWWRRLLGLTMTSG